MDIKYLNIHTDNVNFPVRKYIDDFSRTNNKLFSTDNRYGLSNPKFLDYMKAMNNKNNTKNTNNKPLLINKEYLDFMGIRIEISNANFDLNSKNTSSFEEELRRTLEEEINEEEDEVGPDNLLNGEVKKRNQNENAYKWKERYRLFHNVNINSESMKSENFQVIKNTGLNYNDVGGYELVKSELNQCRDILLDYKKYKNYNVRVPKGLILDGPPGTGKTLLAKAFATECKCSFIAVSGSDFQDKYVGVGASRVKELFELAKKNVPCIIFIDEIDAVGRQRTNEGASSAAEKDNTLNSLLVEMDGFKNNTGIFVMAATNRIDLLDKALLRPGRIDKKIHIGFPDTNTRKAIIDIHIKGKPYDNTINKDTLIDLTEGHSGAEIENLLNEAMLNALRLNNTVFNSDDIQYVSNKMISGWQPNEHEVTPEIIERVAIHEMGHALLAYFSIYYCKLIKVIINLSSPNMLGYTQLKTNILQFYTKEALIEQLMITFGGRIAEELIYGESITTGATEDIKQARELAKNMVTIYGMGNVPIYSDESDKYKEIIDNEVMKMLEKSYISAKLILTKYIDLIKYSSKELLKNKKLTYDDLDLIYKTYDV